MAMQQTRTGLHEMTLFTKSEGVNNKLDPTRLSDGQLVVAENIVIDLSGGISRREGETLLHATPCHSLFSCGRYGLGIFSGVLSTINEDLSVTSLVAVGNAATDYDRIFDGQYDTVYFTNKFSIGKVVNRVYSNLTLGQYVGISSAETLTTDYLPFPPKGQLLNIFNGRLYVAANNMVYYSDRYDFARFRSTNYYVYDSRVTMLKGLNDGIFIGTQNDIFFNKGEQPEDMAVIHAYPSGAIVGSAVKVGATDIGMDMTDDVVVFSVSGKGICIGTNAGSVTNLTSIPVIFPSSYSGACFVNSDNQYIVSIGG